MRQQLVFRMFFNFFKSVKNKNPIKMHKSEFHKRENTIGHMTGHIENTLLTKEMKIKTILYKAFYNYWISKKYEV